MDIFKNQFIQALGLGAAVWLVLRAIGLSLAWALFALEAFSRWYRYIALPASEEIAIGCAIVYLVAAGFFSSRNN